jgi:hypothetical protein
MPASTFTVGYGSKIYMATITMPAGTIGTYTAIAQTKDLKGPEPEVGDIKITNNDSPNNTKEYAPGMIEPGEMSFEMVYTKTQATTLFAAFGDGNTYSFKELYVDGSTTIFPGFIKKIGIETKTEDEANMAHITIKLTGKPVFTAGT